MQKKLLYILLLSTLFIFTSCVARRFNSVVGNTRSYALENLGPPKQIIKTERDYEVWIYPVSNRVSTDDVDDQSDSTSAVTQVIAQGIADSVMGGLGLTEPYRYLLIDKNGKVVKWGTN